MRVRMASFPGLAVAVVLILAGASPAGAQQVVKFGEGQTLTISGFVSATMFSDRGLFGGFGQGQNAEFAASPANQPASDKTFTDGDVRNTRINFTFSSTPVLGKWAPKATLEADFFGAFNGNPPFGDEQPQMRIRFAYVDLSNGRTTVRIGQYWSPLFGETPVSLTHLAFPVGYGSAGKIGWRYPGIFIYHDLTVGKPVNVQLQLAAFKGSGPFAAGNARDSTNLIGNGQASGLPELEALLNFSKRSATLSWSGYVVGHLRHGPAGRGALHQRARRHSHAPAESRRRRPVALPGWALRARARMVPRSAPLQHWARQRRPGRPQRAVHAVIDARCQVPGP